MLTILEWLDFKDSLAHRPIYLTRQENTDKMALNCNAILASKLFIRPHVGIQLGVD